MVVSTPLRGLGLIKLGFDDPEGVLIDFLIVILGLIGVNSLKSQPIALNTTSTLFKMLSSITFDQLMSLTCDWFFSSNANTFLSFPGTFLLFHSISPFSSNNFNSSFLSLVFIVLTVNSNLGKYFLANSINSLLVNFVPSLNGSLIIFSHPSVPPCLPY